MTTTIFSVKSIFSCNHLLSNALVTNWRRRRRKHLVNDLSKQFSSCKSLEEESFGTKRVCLPGPKYIMTIIICAYTRFFLNHINIIFFEKLYIECTFSYICCTNIADHYWETLDTLEDSELEKNICSFYFTWCKKIQTKYLVFCLFFILKKVDFNQFYLSFHSSKKEHKLKSFSCRISSIRKRNSMWKLYLVMSQHQLAPAS